MQKALGSAPAWLLRGAAAGALVVGIRVLLSFVIQWWPTHSLIPRVFFLLVLVGAAAAWGLLDGRADREANPDPERGADLTALWLKAAFVAGLGSGVVAWLLGKLPRIELGGEALSFELTSSAAFIVLVVFLSALAGVVAGRILVARQTTKIDA